MVQEGPHYMPQNKLESIHSRSDGENCSARSNPYMSCHEYYAQFSHDGTYYPEPLPPMSRAPFTEVEIATAISKILDSLAVEQAQQGRPESFREMPCFAYLKQRSAEDCILRVANHCRMVRQLLSQRRPNTALGKPSLRGGLQVCVDLSQAFDRVPRQLVEDSIMAAGFPPDVESSRIVWLRGGTFQFVTRPLAPAFLVRGE